MISEAYGLRKNSPTVGAYFFAEDYLRFVKNPEYYISLEIKMISANKARHREWIYRCGNHTCPVGVLDNIEIVFVHYKDSAEAYEKWMRRKERVNWNNLIFKFSNMNHCRKELLQEFDALDLPGKKIMFVNRPSEEYKYAVYYPGFENEKEIRNDSFYWNRYFDVTAFINGEGIRRKNIR